MEVYNVCFTSSISLTRIELTRFLSKPGGDLLSRALRQSTIGAKWLNDRVRNGIGWGPLAVTTRLTQEIGNPALIKDLNASQSYAAGPL